MNECEHVCVCVHAMHACVGGGGGGGGGAYKEVFNNSHVHHSVTAKIKGNHCDAPTNV